MLTEKDYCDYKLVLELKELGYDYTRREGLIHLYDAQKWLREEKNLYVEVVVKIYSVNHDGYVRNCCDDETVYIDEVKPYLFPMSSMTDEQKDFYWNHSIDFDDAWTEVDWLNAHHFDYRGLIEKGLALDATGLNIYKMK